MAIEAQHAEKMKTCLTDLKQDLLDEMLEHGSIKAYQAGDFVVKQDEQVKYLPILLEGCIKVYSDEDGVSFLLYHIFPAGSCIFSFAHLFTKGSANFSAQAADDSLLLLIPAFKVAEWQTKYPAFNALILREYQKHYLDLLETTRQVVYHNLEDRLLSYLQVKSLHLGSDLLAISHQTIANDFATSREVISRVMKKMEKDGKLVQEGRRIRLLG
ncbi:Crp/Fnr family transcriptional regulator [Chitinophaga agrisoli]|uniref:Crp/Fnr family transcriptional regulator n=1 Tax=Chitinophaga agrisoli TaxID=2607653 RepID=A0A5B2VLH2_9BACT|nr:Crp/Fnr family transcriptional regulator [Chitinophaga agrisoli]KAA2239049.1 Crp/Fnr family transcriptional regulator [Chitinophaga agrisoli]